MTAARLIFRSLIYYARAHLGAFLGAALGSAVLIGALVVGDSVRASLRHLAELRLGAVELALATGDRLFRAELLGAGAGGTVAVQAGQGQPARALAWAPVLQLRAVAANSDDSARANQVQLYGVDDRFWTFAPQSRPPPALMADGVALNEPLARQLKVRVGDEVVLRAVKPAALSADAPLAPEEHRTVARRLKVQAVLADNQFGRFSLLAQQTAPFNAFVPLLPWGGWVEATNRANLLLVREPGKESNPQLLTPIFTMSSTGLVQVRPPPTPQLAALALRQHWSLDDLQIQQVFAPTYLELRSPRVFLDPVLARQLFPDAVPTNALAAAGAHPGPGMQRVGVLTYFVNELRLRDRATPYSMVTATGPPLVPPDLRDDEILISQWLANDLAARPGDELTLTYYVVGSLRQLEERSARFRVRGVLPMDAPALDRSLMPDFPGMNRAQNCRDWDTGLPIKTDRIRVQDEEYWRVYRGTPKALVNLAAGQRLWSNRFGNLTAIRFYPGAQDVSLSAPRLTPRNSTHPTAGWSEGAQVVEAWEQNTDPAAIGLRFRPVREEALAAGALAQDFGQLFLGFSFFLVAAALILMALLFQFGLEQRATETGTLRALGFKPRQVRLLLLGEAGGIALLGGCLGAWAGPWYAKAMLTGLATSWNQAVGGTALIFHAERSTLVGGALATAAVTWGTLWLALRRQARQPVHALLSGGAELEWASASATPARDGARRARRYRAAALASVVLALALVAFAIRRPDAAAAGAFFGAGSLLLLAGLASCAAWLAAAEPDDETGRLTVSSLGLRNVTRRPRRSLAVIGLLACGCSLIAAIGVFRLEAVRGAERRASGTGGFALIGQATEPVIQDLNHARGRETYGLDTNLLAGVSLVPFRVRDGEDASCLNLNRARQPRLVGVRADLLDTRGAFTFARVAKRLPRDHPWRLLDARLAGTRDGEVPAIGDEASIVWALGKQVGDTLDYTDESGQPFKLRLVAAVANSILQGNLVIAEDEFVKRFPGVSGYRMFLVDAPAKSADRVSGELTRHLQDVGMELTPTVDRLAAFNAVQNTYLGTFQVLGGLGLALGSVGLGVVVIRNVFERRGELALLLAVGWRRPAAQRLILAEHGALLLAGLVIGVLSAALAVLPAVLRPGAQVPLTTVGLTLAAVLANGILWTWAATTLSLRGRLLEALRNN